MTYIVRHTPDRSKDNEDVFFGPFADEDTAERFCHYMDRKDPATMLSLVFDLTTPIGTDADWPTIDRSGEIPVVTFKP